MQPGHHHPAHSKQMPTSQQHSRPQHVISSLTRQTSLSLSTNPQEASPKERSDRCHYNTPNKHMVCAAPPAHHHAAQAIKQECTRVCTNRCLNNSQYTHRCQRRPTGRKRAGERVGSSFTVKPTGSPIQATCCALLLQPQHRHAAQAIKQAANKRCTNRYSNDSQYIHRCQHRPIRRKRAGERVGSSFTVNPTDTPIQATWCALLLQPHHRHAAQAIKQAANKRMHQQVLK